MSVDEAIDSFTRIMKKIFSADDCATVDSRTCILEAELQQLVLDEAGDSEEPLLRQDLECPVWVGLFSTCHPCRSPR